MKRKIIRFLSRVERKLKPFLSAYNKDKLDYIIKTDNDWKKTKHVITRQTNMIYEPLSYEVRKKSE